MLGVIVVAQVVCTQVFNQYRTQEQALSGLRPGAIGDVSAAALDFIRRRHVIEEAEAKLSADRASLLNVFAKNAAELSQCMNLAVFAFPAVPELGGVKVRFDVTETGSVENVTVLPKDLADDEFAECLVDHLGALSFEPKKATYAVTFDEVFPLD